MRPLTLKMTAFGPYKGMEIVDFTDLKEHRLFVISGATGSGKTTIFDGICFALYGQASGEDRTEIRAMRSDFADDSTQTTVELTFEIHSRVYRIMRQIPFLKAGNKTETAGRCEFYEQRENGEFPIVDRQIVSEINKKVEELIGFTQAQFSQIVMLPQGEFRKFLTSDTENKETIMRKIFKTEPYREIVTQLKERKDEAYAAFMSEKQLSEGYIQQIASGLPIRDSMIFSVLSNEHYSTSLVIQGLAEELLFYQKRTVEDKKSYSDAYQQHEEKLTEYHVAKNLNERFIECEQKETRLAELSQQILFMENEERRLANAERAALIEEIEKQFISLKQEVIEKEIYVNQATKNSKLAVKKMEETEIRYRIEENRKVQREELAEKIIRLTDHLPAVSSLASKRKALDQIAKEVHVLKKKQMNTIEVAMEASEKTMSYKSKIEVLENKLMPLEEKIEELNETNEKVRIVDEYIAIQKQVHHFEKEKNRNEIHYENEKNAYSQLEKKWLDNQVANIAATLHDGDACPVCGSMNHPAKSEVHAEKSITKEELERANEQLATVESVYRTAAANLESATDRLLVKLNELTPYAIQAEETEEASSQLHVVKKELELEIARLREQRIELTELREQLKVQSVTTEKLAQEKVEMESSVLESTSLLNTEQSKFEMTLQAIPEDVRVLDVLEGRIAEFTKEKFELERAWEAVQKLREEAKAAVTTAQATVVHANQSLEEARGKQVIAEERLYEALRKSEFQTEALYNEAKMDESERILLKDKLLNFNQQLHTLRIAISELHETLKGKEKVDLGELEIAISELKHVYETALKAYNASLGYEQAASTLIEKVSMSMEKLDNLEHKHGKITDLYDVVRGHNELKISFERYIQIEYLEQIIQVANERLKEISNGQFILMRSDRQEVRGKQSGLGLDVYDAYTGQTRDVKTLSGGEKFNASLCLALGMADVIQSFQGSVSIDTMFIDEGFGSLDEESLSKAIDTLIDLQKSGRMIGVISHVEELKAAFPAILEVTKSREGHSHTSFLIK